MRSVFHSQETADKTNVLPPASSWTEDGLNIPNIRAVKRYRSLSLSSLFPTLTDFRINGSPAKQIRHLLLAEEDCMGVVTSLGKQMFATNVLAVSLCP